MRTRKALVLASISCLPTATSINPSRPEGASGYDARAMLYVLTSSNPEDLVGGPQVVVLAALTDLSQDGRFLDVGDDIKTSHSGGYKNLPSRRITGIRFSDGTTVGEVPNAALPHWATIGTDQYEVQDIKDRVLLNRAARDAAKAEARLAKKRAKESTTK